MDVVHYWPHNWYGLWRTAAHDYDDVPTLLSAQDPSWSPRGKDQLIGYLEACEAIVSSTATAPCWLCSDELPEGCYHFDGVWFWPASLAHYVRKHCIVLPDRLVEHIRDRGCVPPKEGAVGRVRLKDLSWPDSYGGWKNLAWDD